MAKKKAPSKPSGMMPGMMKGHKPVFKKGQPPSHMMAEEEMGYDGKTNSPKKKAKKEK